MKMLSFLLSLQTLGIEFGCEQIKSSYGSTCCGATDTNAKVSLGNNPFRNIYPSYGARIDFEQYTNTDELGVKRISTLFKPKSGKCSTLFAHLQGSTAKGPYGMSLFDEDFIASNDICILDLGGKLMHASRAFNTFPTQQVLAAYNATYDIVDTQNIGGDELQWMIPLIRSVKGEVGADRVWFGGFSLGGFVAHMAWCRHIEHADVIDGYVSIAGSAIMREECPLTLRAFDKAPDFVQIHAFSDINVVYGGFSFDGRSYMGFKEGIQYITNHVGQCSKLPTQLIDVCPYIPRSEFEGATSNRLVRTEEEETEEERFVCRDGSVQSFMTLYHPGPFMDAANCRLSRNYPGLAHAICPETSFEWSPLNASNGYQCNDGYNNFLPADAGLDITEFMSLSTFVVQPDVLNYYSLYNTIMTKMLTVDTSRRRTSPPPPPPTIAPTQPPPGPPPPNSACDCNTVSECKTLSGIALNPRCGCDYFVGQSSGVEPTCIVYDHENCDISSASNFKVGSGYRTCDERNPVTYDPTGNYMTTERRVHHGNEYVVPLDAAMGKDVEGVTVSTRNSSFVEFQLPLETFGQATNFASWADPPRPPWAVIGWFAIVMLEDTLPESAEQELFNIWFQNAGTTAASLDHSQADKIFVKHLCFWPQSQTPLSNVYTNFGFNVNPYFDSAAASGAFDDCISHDFAQPLVVSMTPNDPDSSTSWTGEGLRKTEKTFGISSNNGRTFGSGKKYRGFMIGKGELFYTPNIISRFFTLTID